MKVINNWGKFWRLPQIYQLDLGSIPNWNLNVKHFLYSVAPNILCQFKFQGNYYSKQEEPLDIDYYQDSVSEVCKNTTELIDFYNCLRIIFKIIILLLFTI